MNQINRLEMRGIQKNFGSVRALVNGNLLVRPGEVHALMGANGAGKSTLMNILGGVLSADSGIIVIDGCAVTIRSARDAARHGIAFVHQELTTLPTMNVAENIFIDGFPGPAYRINRKEMMERAAELLSRVECQASPADPVHALSTGNRQLVEIARTMKAKPRTIILDEPTSSLSVPERNKLFELIESLKNQGTSIVFITHFLDEIFAVCDRVTIMRDGATVSSSKVVDTSRTKVVQEMMGSVHETDRVRVPVLNPGKILLKVDGLDGGPLVNQVSFNLHRGEIVGMWGLLGSGRTEIVRTLTGLDPISKGEIRLCDEMGGEKLISPANLRYKTGLVTEDRQSEGLILPFSITQNISLPDMKRLTGAFGLLRRRKEDAAARALVDRLKIKVSSLAQSVSTLSGGNQQKVVFARWLNLNPPFYIFDEPTRGLDTGAKTEILKLIVSLAEEGAAILMISSELEELMRVADRYLTVKRGQIADALDGNASRQDLMEAVASQSELVGAT